MATDRWRRICFLVILAIAFVSWGLLLSLQPTFYPTEAEAKGATPSQYGFVFGIVNLVAFLTAPLFGRYGEAIGPRTLFNCGSLTQGLSGVAFGLLDVVSDGAAFIGISYLLRAVEGAGNAAANASINGLLAEMFPGNLAVMLAYSRMFMGMGYMLGPIVGSALYSLGGFGLPFYTLGSVATLAGVVLMALLYNPSRRPQDLPGPEEDREATPVFEEDKQQPVLSIPDVLKSPALFLPYLDALICFSGNGMIEAMLEPHLKEEANATQLQVALSFFILGGSFMVMSPICGVISDRVKHPVGLCLLGNLSLIVSTSLVGPLTVFHRLQPSVPLVYVSMVLAGFGYATMMVASFARAYRAAVAAGFADNMATNIVVSGLWSAAYNLGLFLGPTLAGFMVDAWGFRNSSLVFVLAYLLMLLVDMISLWNQCRNQCRRHQSYQEIGR